MAKQHSSLTGVDLHDPKGIGSENTTKILHLTQSANIVNLSGSILPEITDQFTLGSSSVVFKSGNFNHISASAGITASATSTASFGRYEGDGRGLTNVSATSVTFANITSKPDNLVSGSAQLAEDISGSFNVSRLPEGTVSGSSIASSAQGQVALTTNDVAASAVDLGLQVSDSPTFAGISLTGDGSVTGSLLITGTLTAQEYVVSSSVTYLTQSFSSGSTKFGDTPADDKHEFTGSLNITGSILSNGLGVVSSSTQIFDESSVVSSSAQLAENISGSLGDNATLIRSLTAENISGSLGDNATLIRSLTATDISGSLGDNAALIRSLTATGISGSLGDNAALIRSLTAVNISGSLGDNAALIRSLTAVNISGSFSLSRLPDGTVSGSTQIFDESNVVSSSAQIASEISASFGGQMVGVTDNVTFNHITGSGNFQLDGNITGSATSTGSIGSLIVDGASIDFSNIPDSDPGVAGRVFRSGTDLKISTGGV